MKDYVNGKYINVNNAEIEYRKAISKEYQYNERIRSRTLEESLLALNQSIITEKMANTEDKTLGIACMALFEAWKPDSYKVGDIRTDSKTGYPYECILDHDSTVNIDWTIDIRTLWKPYHSRKKEYALPYEKPTGSHDMYKTGEYMIFTDKEIYKCLSDTIYNPTEYAQAWEVVN